MRHEEADSTHTKSVKHSSNTPSKPSRQVTALKEGLSGSLAPHSPLQNDFKEQKAGFVPLSCRHRSLNPKLHIQLHELHALPDSCRASGFWPDVDPLIHPSLLGLW